MKATYNIFLLWFLSGVSIAQPNCNIYKEDQKCYEACLEAERAVMHPQGSKASQIHFNNSIELCPEMDYAYIEKSVPYAKRGLIHEWLPMINKAVALDAPAHLGWRAWYHFFFMHNYEKAIADLDSLESLVNYDIGPTGDGFYHLNVMKALCYKGLGQFQKAIDLIESEMNGEDYYEGAYDRLHLGVLYLNIDRPYVALEKFQSQIDFNEVSEAYYYRAVAYDQMGDKENALAALQRALTKYEDRLAMHNPYRQLPDEIYKADIEKKMQAISSDL